MPTDRGRSRRRLRAGRPSAPSAIRSVSAARAARASALVTGVPAGVLDERVAAFERALRIVRVERQPQPLERWRAARVRGRAARAPAPPRRRARESPARARRPRSRRPCAPARGASRGERGARSSPRRGARWRAARAPAGAAACGGGRRGPPARARAARASARARRSPGGPAGPAARRAPCSSARAAPQSTGTAASAACVGVEQETAATSSISVRSAWWPTDAITGTRSSATVRHSVSSQNANRSASEPPPRATITTSTVRAGGEVLQRAGDGGRGVAVLHRRERPHDPPGPAAAAQPGEHVVARLAALAGHDADAARERRPRQPLLRREQPLGVERAPQPVELREQVALARQPQRR